MQQVAAGAVRVYAHKIYIIHNMNSCIIAMPSMICLPVSYFQQAQCLPKYKTTDCCPEQLNSLKADTGKTIAGEEGGEYTMRQFAFTLFTFTCLGLSGD